MNVRITALINAARAWRAVDPNDDPLGVQEAEAEDALIAAIDDLDVPVTPRIKPPLTTLELQAGDRWVDRTWT